MRVADDMTRPVGHRDGGDAGDFARRPTRDEGILSGTSCGGAAWAKVQAARRPEDARKLNVVVRPDGGERDLSTWLFEEQPK